MKIIRRFILPSCDNAAEIVQPGKQPFNFPPSPVAPHFSAILRLFLFPIQFMRSNHLDSSFSQLSIKLIAIIRLVTDQTSWISIEKSVINGFLNQFRFVRSGALDMYGDRKTIAVCNCHDFRAFPSFSLANEKTPFFAPAKVASIKHSDKSTSPRFRKSSAKVHNILSIIPAMPHSWKRLWHVWYGGYRLGRSAHCAPVRRIQRIPLRIGRSSVRGRPFPIVSGIGNNGSKMFHCFSLRSIRLLSYGSQSNSRCYKSLVLFNYVQILLR